MAEHVSGVVPGPVVPSAPAASLPTRRRTRLLDRVPQQAGPGLESPFTPPDLPTPPAPRQAHRRALVTVIVLVALAALTTGLVLWQQAAARAEARAAAQARVTALVEQAAADAATMDELRLRAATAAAARSREVDAVAAQAAIAAAQATLTASPQAAEEARAALQQVVDAADVARTGLGHGVSPVTLRGTVTALTAPAQAVVDSQAAWQAAEDARLAAEREAAERATQQARSTGRSAPATARSAGAAGGAASAPTTTAPASGWVSGVAAYDVTGLGAELNAHRAANGLGALTVRGSGSLNDHAAAMAAAGSIWHSGADHIVGWVSPVSDSRMIAAYAGSPRHNAWMLTTSASSVSIGAVTYNGRLYTAMVFG